MSGTTETSGNDSLNGGSGPDIIDGGAGNDRISGGSGSDVLDGGTGSDVVNGDSGNDRLIYNLSENLNGSRDIYTGGSGIDTVLLELTQAQWTDSLVRAQLQNYVQFLATVETNTHGEVSNGSASDFVFTFANGAMLTVQMMENLAVSVQSTSGGPYVPIDYLAALITGPATGTVGEAGGVNNAIAGAPTAIGDLYADDLNGADDVFQVVAPGAATANGYGTYGVTANGVWTFTLNNANASVQGLNVGGTLTDTFTALALDGSTKTVTITINGANDAAVISGTATRLGDRGQRGGQRHGRATRAPAVTWMPPTWTARRPSSRKAALPRATARSRSMPAVRGATRWTTATPAVQALNSRANTTLHELVTVATADGTQKVIDITINGANDAAVISGTATRLGERGRRGGQRHGRGTRAPAVTWMPPTWTARRPSSRKAAWPRRYGTFDDR